MPAQRGIAISFMAILPCFSTRVHHICDMRAKDMDPIDLLGTQRLAGIEQANQLYLHALLRLMSHWKDFYWQVEAHVIKWPC